MKEAVMPKFKPSVYGQAILDFIMDGTGNAVVSAVAGSGKTTTLMQAIELIPFRARTLMLAFNREIKMELSDRVSRMNKPMVQVSTVHSFGYSVIRSKYEPEIDERKYMRIWFDVSDEYLQDIDKQFHKTYRKTVMSLVDLGRLNYATDVAELKVLADKFGLEVINGEVTAAAQVIRIGRLDKQTIDLTDMIYLPLFHDMHVPTYEYVFIDECQDLSACQRMLMQRAAREGRFIAVGDQYQCQPKGTKVLMSDGSEKSIENVQVGDRVVSYHKGEKGFYHGYFKKNKSNMRHACVVEDVSSRYVTSLISIVAGDKVSSYTYNHRCVVRINPDSRDHIVYLMRKEDRFRIGVCHLWSINKDFGLRYRMKQEGAEEAWILAAYNNRQEALIQEALVSLTYSIPQTIWKDRSNMTSERIKFVNKLYEDLESSIGDMQTRAKNLLSKYGMSIGYPFISELDTFHVSSTHMFETVACNLTQDIMQVSLFDETNRGGYNHTIKHKWVNISSVILEKTNGRQVYSLKVSKYEMYVADGILTHNSIYGFAGADSESFEKLKSIKNTIELPLSVCYRCGTDIVDKAKAIVSHIEPFEKSGTGTVTHDMSVSEAKSGDMILCRNTFPLVRLTLQYIGKGIKARIKGREIGASIIKMIRDTKEDDIVGLYSALKAELEIVKQTVMKANDQTASEAIKSQTYQLFKEKVDVIKIIGDDDVIKTVKDIIAKLESIFSDDGSDGIQLSTIHRSKGLEADRVFIIHENLMPSKFAEQDWEIAQEMNIMYVAYTRAKSVLAFDGEYDAYSGTELRMDDVKAKTTGMSEVDASNSEFIGDKGGSITCEITIGQIKPMDTVHGKTQKYIMVDEGGNIVSKIGFLKRGDINEGDKFIIRATVKDHSTFRGVKETLLGRIISVTAV